MPVEKRKLHNAMEMVLATQPGRAATTTFISREIERLRLWTRPNDGRFPEAFQIRIRAQKPAYAHLFEMLDDVTVRLVKQQSVPSPMAMPGL